MYRHATDLSYYIKIAIIFIVMLSHYSLAIVIDIQT